MRLRSCFVIGLNPIFDAMASFSRSASLASPFPMVSFLMTGSIFSSFSIFKRHYTVLIDQRREFLDPAETLQRLAQFGVVTADVRDVDCESASFRVD